MWLKVLPYAIVTQVVFYKPTSPIVVGHVPANTLISSAIGYTDSNSGCPCQFCCYGKQQMNGKYSGTSV